MLIGDRPITGVALGGRTEIGIERVSGDLQAAPDADGLQAALANGAAKCLTRNLPRREPSRNTKRAGKLQQTFLNLTK